MDILEKLKQKGWFLTEEAIKKLPDNVDKSDPQKIIQIVVDMDFRGIAEGALPVDLSKKDDSLPGHRVLQIIKIRNLSAPKSNEESKAAPKLLQLELTDGVNQIFALEYENISSISLNTPPGTKVYLCKDKIQLQQGQLVLRANDVQVLGGKVTQLIEKWEMAKQLQKYTKSGHHRIMSGTSGPPPWIPFGQKIQQQNITGGNDKNFKSLGNNMQLNGANDKDNKEKNEFDAMRNEAIAEASKAGAKRIFGGGNPQMLDSFSIKKIMDEGFTEDEAKSALKANRNILEQALSSLRKRRDDFRNSRDVMSTGKRGGTSIGGGSGGGFKDSKKSSKNDDVAPLTKPAANVSLFDFLNEKLPANPETNDKSFSSNKQERSKPVNHDASKSMVQQQSSSSSYHSQQHHSHQSSFNQQHQGSSSHYSSSSINNHHHHHHQAQQQQSHYQKRDHQQSNYGQSHQHQQVSQSQQYQQQSQQNHANHNHAQNRPKFENNLSSSFANRNSTTSSSSDHQSQLLQYQQQQHDNYNNKNRDNKNSRDENTSSSYSSGGQQVYSNRQPRDSSDKFKSNQQRTTNYGQNQRPNERYSSYQKSGSSQQQQYHPHQSQQQIHQYQPQQQQQQQQQLQSQPYQSAQSQYQQKVSSNITSSSGNSNNYESRNRSDYQKRNGYDNAVIKSSSTSSRYNAKETSLNPQQQSNTRNYSDSRQSSNMSDNSAGINKLSENMSKMKVDSSSTSRSYQSQQQQHLTSRNQSIVNATNQTSHYPSKSYHQQSQPQQHQQQVPQVPPPQQPPPQQQPTTIIQSVPHLQQRPPSHPQTVQSTQPLPINISTAHTNYAQLSNGFTYDPSKIIGFQSKEANEYAMNLLKNQAAVAAAVNHATTLQSIAVAAHPSTYATPIQVPTQAFAAPQFVMAQPAPPSTYGIPQCGENWNWKIGDRCFAKYWDDGQFYEAEVTAVSDKTCVVFFVGYGNHEEVLKSDCIPVAMTKIHDTHVTSAPPLPQPGGVSTPLVATTTIVQPSVPVVSQTIVSAAPPTALPAGVIPTPPPQHIINRMNTNRFRGERQMYVPPAKREG